jgi:hypothetical protein
MAQAPIPVTMCWTPEGGAQNCHTFQPGQTAMITVDLRNNPFPAVVIQPLPVYQISAMQQFVDGQTFNQQQTNGTFILKQRFLNVQDLLVSHLTRNVISPSLKLYPATGDDAGKVRLMS